jgi:hypothetical protein
VTCSGQIAHECGDLILQTSMGQQISSSLRARADDGSEEVSPSVTGEGLPEEAAQDTVLTESVVFAGDTVPEIIPVEIPAIVEPVKSLEVGDIISITTGT